jgi:ubiquinol-cytochrome c reductase cytochrome b subunit
VRWLDERLPLSRFVLSVTGAGYPVPRNPSHFWKFGVLNGLALMPQIVGMPWPHKRSMTWPGLPIRV